MKFGKIVWIGGNFLYFSKKKKDFIILLHSLSLYRIHVWVEFNYIWIVIHMSVRACMGKPWLFFSQMLTLSFPIGKCEHVCGSYFYVNTIYNLQNWASLAHTSLTLFPASMSCLDNYGKNLMYLAITHFFYLYNCFVLVPMKVENTKLACKTIGFR